MWCLIKTVCHVQRMHGSMQFRKVPVEITVLKKIGLWTMARPRNLRKVNFLYLGCCKVFNNFENKNGKNNNLWYKIICYKNLYIQDNWWKANMTYFPDDSDQFPVHLWTTAFEKSWQTFKVLTHSLTSWRWICLFQKTYLMLLVFSHE